MRRAVSPFLPLLALGLVGAAPPTAPADPAPPPANPQAYADLWWVILSAKTEPGVVPEGLAQARAAGVALTPARLSSTAFKGLMPCYEVVVAGASADGATARALLTRLKAAGVDAYVKMAGAWVGPRPELEDHCATVGRPPVSPEGFWFGDPVGLPLRGLPAAVSDPLLAAPGTLAHAGDPSTWRAPLPVRTVGAWNVGDPVRGVGGPRPGECTITGFARGVYGTPHWGALQADHPLRAPACGQEALYATTDCDALVYLPATSTAEVYTHATAAAAPTWLPRLRRAVEATVAPTRAEAAADAQARGVSTHEEWRAERWTSPSGEVWVVQAEIVAGEGEWACGQDEFARVLTWVVGADGAARWGPRDTLGERVEGVVDVDGDRVPELVLRDEITGSPHVLSATVDTADAWAYCDCPC